MKKITSITLLPKNIKFHRVALLQALLVGTVWCSTSYAAEQCSPVEVTRVTPIDARPIMVNGEKKGVSVKLQAIVHNTNKTRPYSGNSTLLIYARNNPGGGAVVFNKPFTVNARIAGGRTTTVTTERINFEKFKNNYNVMGYITAQAYNEHCEHIQNPALIASEFTYDLTPVYNRAKPKLIRGRINKPWYTEANSQRPPTGAGAPRPRPRSSQSIRQRLLQPPIENNSRSSIR